MARNRSETSCRCGQPLDEEGQEREALMTPSEYSECAQLLGPLSFDLYLFRKIVCPLCKATYAGWYEATPAALLEWDKPWRLTDSSYYSSFNDEPWEGDKPRHPDPAAYVLSLERECAIQVNQIRDMEAELEEKDRRSECVADLALRRIRELETALAKEETGEVLLALMAANRKLEHRVTLTDDGGEDRVAVLTERITELEEQLAEILADVKDE